MVPRLSMRQQRTLWRSLWLAVCAFLALLCLCSSALERRDRSRPAWKQSLSHASSRGGRSDAVGLSRYHTYTGPVPDTCAHGSMPVGHWLGSSSTSPGSPQLFGTTHVQRKLWELQNPKDCSTARFLFTPQHYAGIGSIIHMTGQALAVASELGRVLVMEFDPNAPFHDPAWCGTDKAFDACYFLPLSSCKPPEGQGSPVTIQSWEQADSLHSTKVLRVDKHFLSPSRNQSRSWQKFAQLLEASPVDPTKYFYWWRAQSAAFIVRPNARMLEEIDKLHAEHFAARYISPGTVSVHVRKGDKATEYPDTPDSVYVERAQQALLAQPDRLQKIMFLSTDDPQSVESIKRVVDWEVQYVDLERKSDPSKSILTYAKENGPGREMAESLLNLDLALECDAWIGTLTSNWCRLIDELRATVRCKLDGVYLDAFQSHPPQELEW